jgi:CBS domain containing-hemolysin-like protein
MAGYVFGALGRAPEVGDEVSTDGILLRVFEIEGSRIQRLEVEFRETPPPAQSAAAEN